MTAVEPYFGPNEEFILCRADDGKELARLHGDLVVCGDRRHIQRRKAKFNLRGVRLLAVHPDGSITLEASDL